MRFLQVLLSPTFAKYKASIDVAGKQFSCPNDPFSFYTSYIADLNCS